jgi:hypothetical protein
MSAPENSNPEVDDWFQKQDNPLKDAMLAARKLILMADPRISENIKWSTPTFEYKGNLASFQPRAKQFVSLLFHRGSEIPGDHPRLEGDAALSRVMRFRDAQDVEKHRDDLQNVVRAWCELKGRVVAPS